MTAPQDEPVAEVVMSMSPRLPGEHGKYFSWLSNPSDIPADTKLYAQSPAAVRAAAIAECARVGRNLYKGDGGRLDAYDEGWNDGVEAAECAIRALSPRPTVNEAWINKVIEDADMKQTPWTAGTAIRAALQSLGYEVTK